MADLKKLREQVEWAEASQNYLDTDEDLGLIRRILNAPIWNQGTWFARHAEDGVADTEIRVGDKENVCGSYACLAGNTVVQAGYAVTGEAQVYRVNGHRTINGRKRPILGDYVGSVSNVAAQILDLTKFEADALFSGDNELVDIKEIVNGLAVQEGEAIPYPEAEVRELEACLCSDCIGEEEEEA